MPQEYSDEFKTPVEGGEGALPPGSKYVIAAMEARGHSVDVRLWDQIAPPEGHDLVMVALMFVRQFPHLPELFRRLGLHPEASRRHGPPVVCGGHGIHNPVPLARMFDRVVLGDGETIGPDLIEDVAAWDHTPHVWPNRTDRAVKRSEPCSVLVTRQYGRLTRYIEIARGCRSKCGFCELGWTHAYREAPREQVLAAIDACDPGDQVHFLAPDAAGWPHYADAVGRARERGLRCRYNSLRVDTSEAQFDRSATCRFGIEGPSERLRARLLKPYRTERIRRRLIDLNEGGVAGFRLFFLADLPWTQRRDYRELWDLLGLHLPRGGKITLKFTAIVPQPGTPFERMPKRLNVKEYAYLEGILRQGPDKRDQGTRRTAVHILGLQTLGRQALETYLTRAGEELLDFLVALEAARHVPLFGPATIARLAASVGVPWEDVMGGRILGIPVESVRPLPLAYRNPDPSLWAPAGPWEAP